MLARRLRWCSRWCALQATSCSGVMLARRFALCLGVTTLSRRPVLAGRLDVCMFRFPLIVRSIRLHCFMKISEA
jgi:hypothetical protein